MLGIEWEYMKTFSVLCLNVVETPVVNVVKVSEVHTFTPRVCPGRWMASFSQTLTAFQGCSYRICRIYSTHSRSPAGLQRHKNIHYSCRKHPQNLCFGCWCASLLQRPFVFLVKQHHQKAWGATPARPVLNQY